MKKHEAAEELAKAMHRLLWQAHAAGVKPEDLSKAVDALRAYEEATP